MKKIILVLFAGLSVFQTTSFAQMGNTSNDAYAKSNFPLSISFQPIYLINNTLRLDLEMQQKGKASAFITALELIGGNTQLLYSSDDNTKT